MADDEYWLMRIKEERKNLTKKQSSSESKLWLGAYLLEFILNKITIQLFAWELSKPKATNCCCSVPNGV